MPAMLFRLENGQPSLQTIAGWKPKSIAKRTRNPNLPSLIRPLREYLFVGNF